MPRRNNHLIEISELEVTQNPRSLIVTDFLRDKLWDLHARCGGTMENCSVCEDEPHCKKCTMVTQCGHVICVTCLYRLKKIQCPVCRFPHT